MYRSNCLYRFGDPEIDLFFGTLLLLECDGVFSALQDTLRCLLSGLAETDLVGDAVLAAVDGTVSPTGNGIERISSGSSSLAITDDRFSAWDVEWGLLTAALTDTCESEEDEREALGLLLSGPAT